MRDEQGVTAQIVEEIGLRKERQAGEQLSKSGVRTEAIHGNKSQNARQKALNAFKAGQVRVLVAGHEAFSPLEALASVGLGMEWGVPEFFSLLLGGLIRVSQRDGLNLTPHHLEVFIAHVRYDVLHAVSVMLVTSLHMLPDELAVVKNACNMLMAGRTAMMSGLYTHVFGEDCPEVRLEPRYRVTDPRIDAALITARRSIAPQRVVGGNAYREQTATPFG